MPASAPVRLSTQVVATPSPAASMAAAATAAGPAHVELPRRETVKVGVSPGAVPPAPCPPPSRGRLGGEGFKPGDEDRYDIPAFLRLRNQNAE